MDVPARDRRRLIFAAGVGAVATAGCPAIAVARGLPADFGEHLFRPVDAHLALLFRFQQTDILMRARRRLAEVDVDRLGGP